MLFLPGWRHWGAVPVSRRSFIWGEQGIEYGGGFGLYMIQYALHKMSIALFSAILFVMNWEFMKSWFGDYAGLLAGGYAVTFVITIGLFLFCCSKKFPPADLPAAGYRKSKIPRKI